MINQYFKDLSKEEKIFSVTGGTMVFRRFENLMTCRFCKNEKVACVCMLEDEL
jgi:hypothetical protein